ncbi:hypothetical protein ACQBJO_04515 [Janibacter sp. G349]|uniref:hypothetical protein n=1 Tax=Janibacter sp. G349 TaxID=3405424 RepID=UPI003B76A1D6
MTDTTPEQPEDAHSHDDEGGRPHVTREGPLDRHQRVLAVAEDTDFVVSHQMLRAIGVSRQQAARQVSAGRWTKCGSRTFAVRTGPLAFHARCWRGVWETGERIAVIDGVSSLQLAGLKGWDEGDVVFVSVVHRHDRTHREGVQVRKLARRVPDEVISSGVPRTRPAVAAIRAAHWAASDRAAATLLAMAVQQRLVTPDQLVTAGQIVKGRTRRAFIAQVVADIATGAHSLNELDFAAACRARGLPEPTRQAVRTGSKGRVYLDVLFEKHGLVVEIDGAGHLWGLNGVADALRANQVVIDGDRVLRINVLGWRLDADAFMDQVTAALRSGWARENLARHNADTLEVPPDEV